MKAEKVIIKQDEQIQAMYEQLCDYETLLMRVLKEKKCSVNLLLDIKTKLKTGNLPLQGKRIHAHNSTETG